MAQNGRVNPDCSYAANPYHECTETCLRRIMEAPPQKNKKSSGFIPLKFRWKKKLDSKAESPVTDRTPASKVTASYHSEKKRVETIINEPVSTERHNQDVMVVAFSFSCSMSTPVCFLWLIQTHPSKPYIELVSCTSISWQPIYQKDQAKGDVEHFAGNHTKTDQYERKVLDKVVPCAHADDTGKHLSAGGLLDFSLSGISITNDDEDSGEETESLASEPRVPVGGYHVRESYAPILHSIFNKYGDIGASVQLESAVMRTYYVECVCFVVQELHSTSITEFTRSKVKELMAIVKDVESAQIQVAWLRSILNEIAEYIELINQYQSVGMAKAHSDSEIESLREDLESDLKTLAQKEQEVAAMKNQIAETRDRLMELELRSRELDKSMSTIKSKVDSVDGKSLIEELL